VTVRSGRDDGNVGGVLDGGEDSGSEDELLPGLADVEDVDTWESVKCLGNQSVLAAAGAFLPIFPSFWVSRPLFLLPCLARALNSTSCLLRESPQPPHYPAKSHSPSALRL
jgi:hypothetical protein